MWLIIVLFVWLGVLFTGNFCMGVCVGQTSPFVDTDTFARIDMGTFINSCSETICISNFRGSLD